MFELPKVAADDFSVGEPIYWDSTPGIATVTSSGNTALGVAVAAAAVDAATVTVRLSGF